MLAKVALVALLAVSCGSAAQPPGPVAGQGGAAVDGAGGLGGAQGADAGAPDAGGTRGPSDGPPEASLDATDAPKDAPAGQQDAAGDGITGEVGQTDGPGEDAADAGNVCTAPAGQYGPFPGCQVLLDPKTCDAVCQSGCGCGERCKLVGGNAVCSAEGPPFVATYDACDPKNDRCRPGAICLQESPDHPACGAHCYRHCRTDADCSNARCTIDVQFGNSVTTQKVCSPPMDSCNPFGPAMCSPGSMRAYPTFGCYVMSGDYPDVPICDCAGTTPIGMSCSFNHECVPGAECVLIGSARLCRRVCKAGLPVGSPAAAGGCPVLNPTCTPFPGGSTYGYCH